MGCALSTYRIWSKCTAGYGPNVLQRGLLVGPTGLPAVLCDFVNLVLAGGIPHAVRYAFFGATLHALKKKDGGLRQIAVGLCLRRLASKVANLWATVEFLSTLAPHQLGLGVRGGAEPIVHAARAFVASASIFHALVKLDFMHGSSRLYI